MEEIKLKTKISSHDAVNVNTETKPDVKPPTKEVNPGQMGKKYPGATEVATPEGLEDLRTYQNLTFKVLDKKMKERCNAGYSGLYLSYSLSEGMTKYLRQKGFTVIVYVNNSSLISW
jgi:hypothetical protein